MPSQSTQDQFAYVLTPSDSPPPPSAKVSSTHASGTNGGCSVCKITASFDPKVGQISLQLPEATVSSLSTATVVAVSGGDTLRYEVSHDAVRTLLLTGHVDWYLPPLAAPPTSLVVSFTEDGDAASAATHDVKVL